ncbi:MAG: outer membrane lipoprotein carrier protein LolA [Oligoflexales bacterium]
MKAVVVSGLMILAVATASFGEKSDEKTNIEAQHEELFTSVDSIQVDFVQEVYRKLRNKTIRRQGDAIFAKPNNFFWSFVDSDKKEENFYFNGRVLSHYKQAENTVTHFSSHASLTKELEEVVKLVLDAKKLTQSYETTNISKDKDKSEVSLVPKNKGATAISKIDVTVAHQPKYVQEVAIEYKDGNKTTFHFKNPKMSAIDPKVFVFTNPGKVEEKKL